MTVRPRRTCLVVPGSSARMLEKARGLAADEVVVDLEDGVAAAEKEAARAQAAEALRRGGLGRTTALRINDLATPWWEDDLRTAAEARPDVVVVPKVETPDDVAAVAERLPAGIGLEVLIETARGLVEVERIAAAGYGLEALVFGPADFAASVGVPVLTIGAHERRAQPIGCTSPGFANVFDHALARIGVAAHAFGLQAVDGPWAVLEDEEGLSVSARRALAYGFDGKWAIHPNQLALLEAAFTPTAEEVARAERILAGPDGAIRDEGELVDAASRRLAEALLARARR